jgi:hypothetical protein
VTQLPLLGERGLQPAQQQVARQVTEQRRQLARCTATLRDVIQDFCRERLAGQASLLVREERVTI